MPGKGTFGARVICAQSGVGKFTEIGFTCTQPCGSECASLESMLSGGGEDSRVGEAPAAPRAPRRVGFGKVVSHLACPSARASHPLSSHLPFPAPSPSTPPTPPPKSAELRFRL